MKNCKLSIQKKTISGLNNVQNSNAITVITIRNEDITVITIHNEAITVITI